MKKIILLVVMVCAAIIYSHAQNATHIATYNFTTFSNNSPKLNAELDALTSKEFKSHPEYGILPYDAPCRDCFELLQKRDQTHRYYVIEGTKGKQFYQETSYSVKNYYDESGVLRSIDPHIRQTAEHGVFKSGQQPLPVTINVPHKFTSLLNAGKELRINNDVTLYIKHTNGSISSMGQPSWSDYTAGDDGVLIHNFYPGIDMEMHVQEGGIECNYRINKPLHLSDGWLVVHDNVALPPGLTYDYSYSDKQDDNYTGILYINNEAGIHYFTIGSPGAFDVNQQTNNTINLAYHTNTDGSYDAYVPIDWMNDAQRSYPLVIDPLILANTILPMAQITGSGYSATCFTSGCPYNLGVYVPPAVNVTDIKYTFHYQSSNPCELIQGAFDITSGTCRTPANGAFRTCNIPISGGCITDSLSCFGDMLKCIPAPQCSSYRMPFTLTFYRCIAGGGTCASFSCVHATSDWTMFIRGTYITVTAHDTTICQRQVANLTAVADSGVDTLNYTFKWYDANGLVGTGNPLSVSPQTTTTYTVTAFDCQAQGIDTLTDSAQAVMTVTVNPFDNPGFTISQNPVCANVPVTITGLGAGPSTSYSWLTPGGNPASTNNQQSVNVSYASGGTYNITLRWTSPTSGCVFDSVLPITVTPAVLPAVNISVNANPVCPGTNVTFTANVSNGGGGPTFQWYINGQQVAGATSNPFSSSTLDSGDVVTVHIISNAVCPEPDSAVSNQIIMQVNTHVSPAVNITVAPSDTICPGTTLTFTATSFNQGNAPPSYQWYVNGGQVGINDTSFSTPGLNTGDVISVHLLNSNAPCVLPDSAVSNLITVVVVPNSIPSVTIAVQPSNTICAGDTVTFTATPNNQGSNPDYQWYVDGQQVGTNSPTFTSWSLINGDIITVHLLHSDVRCVVPDSAVSNTITMTVNPLIVPLVNIAIVPSDTICAGDNVTFTATPVNGGTNPAYQWYVDGTQAGINSTTFASSALNNGDVISVHLLNSNVTCPSPDSAVSSTILMVVIPRLAPSITVAPVDTVCAGSNITFTATPTLEGTAPNYQWYVNGSAVPGNNSPSYSSSNLNNGDNVTVHLLNSNIPCIMPDSAVSNAVVANVLPNIIPTVSIVDTPAGKICVGQTIIFTASQTGGGPTPSYQWYVNNAPQGTNDSTFSSSTWTSGDVVWVKLKSDYQCPTPDTANSNQIIIDMYPPMSVVATGDTTICPGDSVPINSTAGGGEGPPYTYTWLNGVGTDSSEIVAPQQTTTYTISATDACSSTPATKSVNVIVSPIPKPDFTFNPSEPTENSRSVHFTDRSTGAVSWNWNFGDTASANNSSTLQFPNHTYSGLGTYTIWLVVKNSSGCIDSISYRLDVTEEYTYYIPNAFTPNSDGVNDYFAPQGTHDLIYTMTIYDRWGEKIFETDNTSLPWGGQVAGSSKVAEAGVYVYRVKFNDSRYTSETIVGSVTLVR